MLLKTSALAVFAVILSTAGQILLRAGMEQVGYIGGPQLKKPVRLALNIATTPQILAGLAIFVISAALWLVVLSRAPISFAYPFAGITYVVTTGFAQLVLHEHVTSLRWLGVAVIVLGVVVISRTAPPGLD
ncbi:MAG: EamA family transporter [Actinomycetota bacterium]